MPAGGGEDRDPLTGLGRSGTFQAEVEARCQAPGGRSFIVGIVDIEGLRHINREFGNEAGDALLCEVADRLTSSGLADVVARVGGDEFALLAEDVDPDDGGQWFRRVRLEALSRPFAIADRTLTVRFRTTRRAGPSPPGRDLFWEVQRDAFVDSTREMYQRATAYDQALQRVDDVVGENERLRHLAMTDPLTGLLNRRGVHEQLEKVENPLALAFVDLDDLGELNKLDELWEDGDAALCGVADRLRDAFGAENVGRWGGDEFLVISTSTSAEGTADLLIRILEQCRSELVISGCPISFSAGVSACETGTEEARAGAQRAVRKAKVAKATVVLGD